MEQITLLFMAAGLSSRFGGSPKMLSKIGPNNESLFEMSIRQLKDRIKVCHIHLVVNSFNQKDIINEVQGFIYGFSKGFIYLILRAYKVIDGSWMT